MNLDKCDLDVARREFDSVFEGFLYWRMYERVWDATVRMMLAGEFEPDGCSSQMCRDAVLAARGASQ